MAFDFEAVYDFFAKPMDGRHLKDPASDPVLMKLKTKNGKVLLGAVAPPILVLQYLAMSDGQAKLKELISNSIVEEDENFCMLLAYEGRLKLFQGGKMSDYAPMLEKRLTNDPAAEHVLMIQIFHQSGSYTGFLPVDANRVVSYAPAYGLQTKVLHVNPDADQNLH